MSLSPFRSFGSRAAALATAAVVGVSALGIGSAGAQTSLPKAVGPDAPAAQTVSADQCAAFFHYVAEELRAFPKDLSKTFIGSALRFKRAGCAATDKDGPIYIITMTDQDGASLRTALRRMGTYDIIGVSGVKGCARPATNVCPSNTSSAAPTGTGG